MSDNEVRIKVGIKADASASSVMAPLEQAVKRTRKTIENEMGAAGKAIGAATQKGTTSAEKSWHKLEREVERMAQEMLAAERQAARQGESVLEQAERRKTQIIEREAVKRRQAQEREAAKAAKSTPWYAKDIIGSGGYGGAIGIGRRAGIRVGRGAAMAYGYGGAALAGIGGIGRDILGGLGVDTSLTSLVGKSQEQQSLATKISNSGYIPGRTDLVAPGDIMKEARTAGNATGTDTTEVLSAMQDFVGKTGDLQTARETIQQMAVLSKATGTNLADMANAAAEVSNNLGDVPNKAKVTSQIMQQIAGQGKLGAVEIRDLATQMAKLAAGSGAFKGGAVANLATLGAMAQESKLRGGSASATQATTAVTAFAATLTKSATLKNWGAHGITPFADKYHTTLSDPESIIKAALRASDKSGHGASIDVLRKLFPSEQGMRAVRGFANVYNQAGGGDKGMQAVTDEFESLKKAQLDQEEVTRAFNAAMQNSQSQVAIFNNKMSEVAEQLAGAVLPAFEELAPVVVNAAGGLVNLLATLTGAKGQQAHDTLDNFSDKKLAEDMQRLQDTATVLPLTPEQLAAGQQQGTKVYDPQALAVVKNDYAKRNAAAAQLTTDAQNEAATAADYDRKSNPIDTFVTHAFGMESGADKAHRLGAQASTDASAAAGVNNDEHIRILGDILRAIQEGNAQVGSSQPDASGGRESYPAVIDKD